MWPCHCVKYAMMCDVILWYFQRSSCLCYGVMCERHLTFYYFPFSRRICYQKRIRYSSEGNIRIKPIARDAKNQITHVKPAWYRLRGDKKFIEGSHAPIKKSNFFRVCRRIRLFFCCFKFPPSISQLLNFLGYST